MNNKSNIFTSIIVSVVVGILFVILGNAFTSHSLGGRVEPVLNEFSNGIQLSQTGTRGTVLKLMKTGTCTLLGDFSITASTTASVDCAITGIRSGDLLDVNLAATTSLAAQFLVKSSQASTTSGYGSVQLYNATGGNKTPSSVVGFGSSTVYRLWRVSNTF